MAILQSEDKTAESSKKIQQRVIKAQQLQITRQGTQNYQLEAQQQQQFCGLGKEQQQFLRQVCERLLLSARAYHRILRLARTIADLESSDTIQQHHLSEAVGLRFLDRN